MRVVLRGDLHPQRLANPRLGNRHHERLGDWDVRLCPEAEVRDEAPSTYIFPFFTAVPSIFLVALAGGTWERSRLGAGG